jgi:hypothetical protein
MASRNWETLYPAGYQFGGFWVTGFLVSVALYWPLFRWQRNLKWEERSRN